ncbi:MAG: hypothetical protein KIT84_11520 [Labilithrix sp.]|nr:hypothetical protein [Labilithrix sp.]MCW5811639.1 hypothetical protein [Labilithrix sp.]
MKTTFLCIPFLLAAAACGGAPDDETASASTQASTTTEWQAAIRCDRAVLDVNRDERREVQLVIHDEDAVYALTHGVEVHDVPAGTINEKGEFILAGRLERGVFHANDFSSRSLRMEPYEAGSASRATVMGSPSRRAGAATRAIS